MCDRGDGELNTWEYVCFASTIGASSACRGSGLSDRVDMRKRDVVHSCANMPLELLFFCFQVVIP